MRLRHKKIIYFSFTFIIIVSIVIFLYPSAHTLAEKLWRPISEASNMVDGGENIYSFISLGNVKKADQILEDKYELSRFDVVEIKNLTWKEDPFSDHYWRFNYYNLETVRDLLFAWRKTDDPKYKDKILQITESFIDKGMDGPYSWDYHGVAFRTMTLVSVYKNLEKENELSVELKEKIQKALKIHGDFLADPTHYENNYNHGLDQSAALLLLAVNFPELDGSENWFKISTERINEIPRNIIDEDGILVENAPYYHFYVLEKLWEINKYSKEYNIGLSNDIDTTINKMIDYCVYILQPDLNIPTIGASLQRKLKIAGVYAEMMEAYPELNYVISMGKDGKKPDKLNMHYPSSGQTIMRSSWGSAEDYFEQTQVIMDTGNYRTDHSDLDALSFSLYSGGVTLMPDAGLYDYEEDGQYRKYFHGTRAHNTVVVDGKDQIMGDNKNNSLKKAYSGFFEEGDGYSYQSGEHELYEGVSHKRAIVLIENSTMIILDELNSYSNHTYEQMFHLFPGAKISTDGLTLTAVGDDSLHKLTIRQFISDGVTLNTVIDKHDPPDGLCSLDYKSTVPCYSTSYLKNGKNVSFITVIDIGDNKSLINLEENNNLLSVKTEKNLYNIEINKTVQKNRKINVIQNFDMSNLFSSSSFYDDLNLFSNWKLKESQKETENHEDVWSNRNGFFEINTPRDGSSIQIINNNKLDLSNKSIYLSARVDDNLDLQKFMIYFSNDNWSKSVMYNLKNSSFDIDRGAEWLQLGVIKGDMSGNHFGRWHIDDLNFDWSKIDSVKLVLSSKPGKTVKINIKDLRTISDQQEARVLIIFDDGWSSVLDAAKIMNKYGIKGNVGVITNSVDKKRYLTLNDLKTLQNNYGWNMVNHSNSHVNAVEEYYNKNRLSKYETDLLDSLGYLIENNINSAPNWYLYPNGKTNEDIKKITGRYYKMARATISGPETFPFSEPLEVRVFGVYSDRADVGDIKDALIDAKKYNHTLFLMFHKFTYGQPTSYTEFQLGEFQKVIEYIHELGLRTVTFSELDRENGLPMSQFRVQNYIPAQYDLNIFKNYKSN